MRSWRQLATLTAGLGVFALGCGDSTGTSGDPVSQAEAEQLAAALVESGFGAFGQAFDRTSGPALSPAATITVTLDQTDTCDGGGTVKISGSATVTADQSGSTGSVNFDFKQTPSGCKAMVTSDQGTVTFTLNGNPNITVKGSFDVTETSVTGSLNFGGGVSWTSDDGRSGNCGIDLKATYNFSGSADSFSGSATESGTVCGVSVSKTVSVSN